MESNKRPETMGRINNADLAAAFIDEQVAAVKAQVGDKKVLLALSGGVDSSVVAALLIKAIGKNLVCVHVNLSLIHIFSASASSASRIEKTISFSVGSSIDCDQQCTMRTLSKERSAVYSLPPQEKEISYVFVLSDTASVTSNRDVISPTLPSAI